MEQKTHSSDARHLYLYSIAIHDVDTNVSYIEFYWAENRGHAIEQAMDAHPIEKVLAARVVPYEQTSIYTADDIEPVKVRLR